MDIWSFYGHLIYFVDIWYILWQFVTFFPVLVNFAKKKSGNPDGESLQQRLFAFEFEVRL
jgi:hypothetical protein